MPSLWNLALDCIAPNPANPRKRFDERSLAELAASLRQTGLLEPLVVRGSIDDICPARPGQIIAGERRWRAAKLAGVETLPCRVLELDDGQAAEAMLAENLQRQDLTPIEEARAFQGWITAQPKAAKGERPNLPQALATRLGKSEDFVRERLRLLELDGELLDQVESGALTLKQARVLVRVRPEEREGLAMDMRRGDFYGPEMGGLCQLKDAQFGPTAGDAAELGDGYRACDGCGQREELFGEDYCFDAQCFVGKQRAWVQLALPEATLVAAAPKRARAMGEHRKGCAGCKGRLVMVDGGSGELRRLCTEPGAHYPGTASEGARYEPSAAEKAARQRELARQRADAELARRARQAAFAWLLKRPPAELVRHAFAAIVRAARRDELLELAALAGIAEKDSGKREKAVLAYAEAVPARDSGRLLAMLAVAGTCANSWNGGGAVGLCKKLGVPLEPGKPKPKKERK